MANVNPITSKIYRASSILNSLSNFDLNLSMFDQNLQDPTLLGFRIEFGNWGSSLYSDYKTKQHYKDIENSGYDDLPCGLKFSTDYEQASGNQIHYYDARTWLYNRGENLRLNYLDDFIKGMLELTSKMPFVFTEISGLSDLVKVDSTKGQRLQKDTKITIKCNESVDLKITTLKQLYKKAAWDEVYQRWVLPDIMRYFKMLIYISDYRWLHSGENSNAGNDINEVLPLIVLECSPCEFVINDGELPSSVKNSSPDLFQDTNIVVNVKNLNVWTGNNAVNMMSNIIGDAITGAEMANTSNGFNSWANRQFLSRKFFLTELNGQDDVNDLTSDASTAFSVPKLEVYKNFANSSVYDEDMFDNSMKIKENYEANLWLIKNTSSAIDSKAYEEYRHSLDYLGTEQLKALARQDLVQRWEDKNIIGLRDNILFDPITGENIDYRLKDIDLAENASVNYALKNVPLYGVYASLDNLTNKLTILLDYLQNPSGSRLNSSIQSAALMSEVDSSFNIKNIELEKPDYNYSFINVSINGEPNNSSLLNNGYPYDSSYNVKLKTVNLETTKSLLSSVLNQNSSLYFDDSGTSLDSNTLLNIELENSSVSLNNSIVNFGLDTSTEVPQIMKDASLDLNSSINYNLIPIELEQALYEANINGTESLLDTIKMNIDVLDASLYSSSDSKAQIKQFALEQAMKRLGKLIDLKLSEVVQPNTTLKAVDLEGADYSSSIKNIQLEYVDSNGFANIKDINLEQTSQANTNIKPIELEESVNSGLSQIKDIKLESANLSALSDLKNVELASSVDYDLSAIKDVQIQKTADVNRNLKEVAIDANIDSTIENQTLKNIELEKEQAPNRKLNSINLEVPIKQTSSVKNVDLETVNEEGLSQQKLKDVDVENNDVEGLNNQQLKDIELEDRSYNYKLKDVELEKSSKSKLSDKLL